METINPCSQFLFSFESEWNSKWNRSWKYVNLSEIHECRNWKRGCFLSGNICIKFLVQYEEHRSLIQIIQMINIIYGRSSSAVRKVKAPWVHCKIEVRVKHVTDFAFFSCCRKIPKTKSLRKLLLQLQHQATIVDTQKKNQSSHWHTGAMREQFSFKENGNSIHRGEKR